jgi:competence protein ComGC
MGSVRNNIHETMQNLFGMVLFGTQQ